MFVAEVKIAEDGWQKLSDVAGISFSSGRVYTIQPIVQTFTFGEFQEAPDESIRGFYIPDNRPLYYEPGKAPLYVRKTKYDESLVLTIGDDQ